MIAQTEELWAIQSCRDVIHLPHTTLHSYFIGFVIPLFSPPQLFPIHSHFLFAGSVYKLIFSAPPLLFSQTHTAAKHPLNKEKKVKVFRDWDSKSPETFSSYS